MAADAAGRYFTQISNSLFRDARISGLAKAVFGLISTHRDGYGISVDAIARHMKEGTGAIKKALRELEQYGYLVRTRVRDDRGRLGAAVYRITDMPNGFEISMSAPYPDTHFRRSAPGGENRPLGVTSGNATDSGDESADSERLRRSEPRDENPPVDSPPVGNRPPKNTSSKNNNSENTTSPPPPSHTGSASAGAGAENAPTARGEGEGSPEGTESPLAGPGGAVPSPRAAADDAAAGPVDGQAPEDERLTAARLLLEGLPAPVTPGARTVRDLAPVVAAALAAGWTRETLTARLTADLPATVHSERALLTHRLEDLPPAPPAAPPVSAPRPARCEDSRHRHDHPEMDRFLYDGDTPIGLCPTCGTKPTTVSASEGHSR